MATYSLSEIDALSRKASRGAGYSWGMAEEVGKAMRWLSAYGFEGPEVLAKHLEIVADKQPQFIPKHNHLFDGNVLEYQEEPSCSIYCGSLINDLGHHLVDNKILSFSNVLSPLLALPSVARVAEAYDISISVLINQTEVICNPNAIVLKDTPHLFGTFAYEKYVDVICKITKGSFQNTHLPSPEGRVIAEDALLILEKFAHKTYAPNTEESRLRGAG